MPVLCDINFLFALCYQGHVHHLQALAWFDGQDDGEVIICRNTQLGLLRLLSNPSVMGADLCTQQRAWEVYAALASDGRFEFSPEPEGLEEFFRSYLTSGQVSAKVWQDTYLAAFSRSGDYRLMTFDRGFRSYEGAEIISLE